MSLLNRLDMFQAILDEGNMTAAAEKIICFAALSK